LLKQEVLPRCCIICPNHASTITIRFLLDLFYYLFMCIYTCLFVINVSMCILSGIGRVWLIKGILVILDSRVFWSFGEQG